MSIIVAVVFVAVVDFDEKEEVDANYEIFHQSSKVFIYYKIYDVLIHSNA